MELTNNQKPKTNDVIVILLSSLLLISCFIAGLFAWKTQKLVKELTTYRLQPTMSPTSTATPDPTADWKTYTNTKYGFSLKYMQTTSPKNTYSDDLFRIYLNGEELNRALIEIDQVNTTEIDPAQWWNSQKSDSYSKLSSDCFSLYTDTKLVSSHIKDEITKDFSQKILIGKSKDTKGCGIWPYNITFLLIPNKLGFLKITYEAGYSIQSEQIISTIKFFDTQTPSPVACTMDAKICPDGSAVGRSGPKCEFSPCPTPKN